MKIFVNDIAATPDSGGVFSILSDFYNEVKNDKKNQWIFLLAGKYFEETNNIKIIEKPNLKKSGIHKLLFEFFFGGLYINKFKPDVYISLQNIATFNVNAKFKVVYLHQPLPFSKKVFSFFKSKERKLAFYQKIVGKIIKYSIERNDYNVIVQTKWMKTAIINESLVTNKDVFILHPKIEIPFIFPLVEKNIYSTFFYPATSFIYKNHDLILKATSILVNEYKDTNFKIYFTIDREELDIEEQIQNQIVFLGRINRSSVFKKYSQSTLIFPSYLETFGLPLLEAKETNTFIFASNEDFSHEILDGYENVKFFNSNDPEKLASLMHSLLCGKLKLKAKSKINKKQTDCSLYDFINNLIEIKR